MAFCFFYLKFVVCFQDLLKKGISAKVCVDFNLNDWHCDGIFGETGTNGLLLKFFKKSIIFGFNYNAYECFKNWERNLGPLSFNTRLN